MNYLGSKDLETKRLLLHKTEEKDLKVLWKILLNEEVSRYYLVGKIHDNWEDEKEFQYKKLSKSENKDTFIWTIETREDNEVIGQISFMHKKDDVYDVGYFLDIDYWKKGLLTEAITETLKYMFLEVGISSINTCVCIENPNSSNVLLNLGATTDNTTQIVDYVFSGKKTCRNYYLTKKDFLKELIRKENLHITIDIDKDPFIKHYSDDLVLNVTGESGSGKSTSIEKYKTDDYIIIDTDVLYSNNKKDKYNEELYNYLINKYKELPNLITDFDNFYKSIFEVLEKYNKFIIIDTALLRYLKDITLLRGDLIVIRTCINNCYDRCIERYKMENKNYNYKELASYMIRKKGMYTYYIYLNKFLDKIDRN